MENSKRKIEKWESELEKTKKQKRSEEATKEELYRIANSKIEPRFQRYTSCKSHDGYCKK